MNQAKTVKALNAEFSGKGMGVPVDGALKAKTDTSEVTMAATSSASTTQTSSEAAKRSGKENWLAKQFRLGLNRGDGPDMFNFRLFVLMSPFIAASAVYGFVEQNKADQERAVHGEKQAGVLSQTLKQQLVADHFGSILTKNGVMTITAGNCEIPLAKPPVTTERMNNIGFLVVTDVADYVPAQETSPTDIPHVAATYQTAEQLIVGEGLGAKCHIS